MKVNLLNLFNTPTKSTTASRLIASIDLSVNRVLTQTVPPRRIRDRTWLRNSTYLANGCNRSNTYHIMEKDTGKETNPRVLFGMAEVASVIPIFTGNSSFSDLPAGKGRGPTLTRPTDTLLPVTPGWNQGNDSGHYFLVFCLTMES